MAISQISFAAPLPAIQELGAPGAQGQARSPDGPIAGSGIAGLMQRLQTHAAAGILDAARGGGELQGRTVSWAVGENVAMQSEAVAARLQPLPDEAEPLVSDEECEQDGLALARMKMKWDFSSGRPLADVISIDTPAGDDEKTAGPVPRTRS